MITVPHCTKSSFRLSKPSTWSAKMERCLKKRFSNNVIVECRNGKACISDCLHPNSYYISFDRLVLASCRLPLISSSPDCFYFIWWGYLEVENMKITEEDATIRNALDQEPVILKGWEFGVVFIVWKRSCREHSQITSL